MPDRPNILWLTTDQQRADAIGDHWIRAKSPTNYDCIINTPCVMRYPQELPAGATMDGIVECVDLMPTLLDAVDVPIPEGVNGVSHWGGLCNGGDVGKDHAIIQHSQPDGNEINTIRTESFKYTRHKSGEEVYFDLEDDPNEFINRAEDPAHEKAVADARAALLDALVEARDPLPVKVAPY